MTLTRSFEPTIETTEINMNTLIRTDIIIGISYCQVHKYLWSLKSSVSSELIAQSKLFRRILKF